MPAPRELNAAAVNVRNAEKLLAMAGFERDGAAWRHPDGHVARLGPRRAGISRLSDVSFERKNRLKRGIEAIRAIAELAGNAVELDSLSVRVRHWIHPLGLEHAERARRGPQGTVIDTSMLQPYIQRMLFSRLTHRLDSAVLENNGDNPALRVQVTSVVGTGAAHDYYSGEWLLRRNGGEWTGEVGVPKEVVALANKQLPPKGAVLAIAVLQSPPKKINGHKRTNGRT